MRLRYGLSTTVEPRRTKEVAGVMFFTQIQRPVALPTPAFRNRGPVLLEQMTTSKNAQKRATEFLIYTAPVFLTSASVTRSIFAALPVPESFKSVALYCLWRNFYSVPIPLPVATTGMVFSELSCGARFPPASARRISLSRVFGSPLKSLRTRNVKPTLHCWRGSSAVRCSPPAWPHSERSTSSCRRRERWLP